jgi:hypothetical protein
MSLTQRVQPGPTSTGSANFAVDYLVFSGFVYKPSKPMAVFSSGEAGQ